MPYDEITEAYRGWITGDPISDKSLLGALKEVDRTLVTLDAMAPDFRLATRELNRFREYLRTTKYWREADRKAGRQ